jgi:MFS family permease
MGEPEGGTQALVVRRASQLFLLTLGLWVVTYARFALGPLQETLRVDLALGDNFVSWLQGPAFAIPLAASAIPLGLIADRYSRVRLLFVFALLAVIASVLTALAPNLAVLVISRALIGLCVAAAIVGAYSLVADLFPPEQRGRATMIVALGEIGGAPAAFAFGGLLLSQLGGGMESWRTVLLWMSALLLLPVFLLLMLREPARTGVVVKDPPLREVWPELWRYREVLVPLLLARIMVWIADGAVLVWAAPTFARRFSLPPQEVAGIVATALLVAGILGPVLGGPIADMCQKAGGARRTISVLGILALLSIPAAVFGLMPSPIIAGISLTVFLALGYTIGTAALTVGTIVIPGELRGLYLAVTATVGSIFSFAVAPMLVSLLSTGMGGPMRIGDSLSIVCAGSSLLGAVVFVLARRHFSSSRASGIRLQGVHVNE